MFFVEINERIERCRTIEDPRARLQCLTVLYDETRDGMVAYELGVEYERQSNYDEAAVWFDRAKSAFPLAKFKSLARDATVRVRGLVAADSGAGKRCPSDSRVTPSTLLVVAAPDETIWDHDSHVPRFVPAYCAYQKSGLDEVICYRSRSDGLRWLYLCPRYGYIEPWQPVERHGVSFTDTTTGPISAETLHAQVMFQKRWPDRRAIREFDAVVYVGSEIHARLIAASFAGLPVEVREAEQSPTPEGQGQGR